MDFREEQGLAFPAEGPLKLAHGVALLLHGNRKTRLVRNSRVSHDVKMCEILKSGRMVGLEKGLLSHGVAELEEFLPFVTGGTAQIIQGSFPAPADGNGAHPQPSCVWP